MNSIYKILTRFHHFIRDIGDTPKLDSYERRRLGIFNRINFLGFVTGIVIPFSAIFGNGYVPPIAMIVAIAPAFISAVVLICNHYRKYNFAMLWYFTAYPVITALVYVGNTDVGIEQLFVLYGVFAVFFLQNLRYTVFAICISVVCYVVVFVLYKEYTYVLSEINFPFYFLNQFLSLSFIFVGLFLIKKENQDYQKEMLYANWVLKNTNEEIQEQRIELAAKAEQLQEQTLQLSELNAVKNRLFSVVSHDLKTPIYSLRNLFKGMHQNDTPALKYCCKYK